jgi:hypothetical protein
VQPSISGPLKVIINFSSTNAYGYVMNEGSGTFGSTGGGPKTNGIESLPTPGTGPYITGGYGVCDGVDDYWRGRRDESLASTNITHSIWFRMPSLDSGVILMHAVPEDDNTDIQCLVSTHTGGTKLQAVREINNSSKSIQISDTLKANTWYHVAVTYEEPGGVLSLYTNGVLVGTNIFHTSYTNYPDGMYLGKSYTFGQPWAGWHDTWKYWTRTISSQEVYNAYTAGR